MSKERGKSHLLGNGNQKGRFPVSDGLGPPSAPLTACSNYRRIGQSLEHGAPSIRRLSNTSASVTLDEDIIV